MLTHVLCGRLHREPTTSLRGALATKQSIPPFTRLDGLLRSARNDDGNIRSTSSRRTPERRVHDPERPTISKRRIPTVDHEAIGGVIGRRLAHQVHRDAAEI